MNNVVAVAGMLAMGRMAMDFMDTFSGDKASENLTAAEESIRGLTFDVFNENTSCKVMTGIKLDGFETLINSTVRHLGIPDDIRDAILESKLATVNNKVTIDFCFAKGETGNFTFGRIATVKPDDTTINLAYSVYHLEFKLSPQGTEHTKKRKFLAFTTGKKVWRERRERSLSVKEQDHLRTYFKKKIMDGFKEEYADLLERSSRQMPLDEL